MNGRLWRQAVSKKQFGDFQNASMTTRRLFFLVTLWAGVVAIVIGTIQAGWGRIFHLSTSICLSCMGLV